MLEQFVQFELSQISSSDVDVIDRTLAQKLRAHLLTFDENELPMLKDSTLLLGHFIARRGLLRCIDVLSEFYPINTIPNNYGRNYFCDLIASKKYAVANQFILRWEKTGEPGKLAEMILGNEITVFGWLIDGVDILDKDALKVLLAIVKGSPIQLNIDASQRYANQLNLLTRLKHALGEGKNRLQSKASHAIDGLTTWLGRFVHLRNTGKEKGANPELLEKLESIIAEQNTLIKELSLVDDSEGLRQDHKQLRTLLKDCTSHYKIYVRAAMAGISQSAPVSKPLSVRYIR